MIVLINLSVSYVMSLFFDLSIASRAFVSTERKYTQRIFRFCLLNTKINDLI